MSDDPLLPGEEPAPPRPEPSSVRWKPLRLGLVNVFRYEDEHFWFEDGHLLLRGDNGAGKSRVLAMTLPFLFDGEARPERVEPDGDRNKQVAWNLHMNEHDRRVGYTWIEFGRLGEDGEPQFVTLAIGLDAARGRTRLDRWFAAGPRRVGRAAGEFRFLDEDRRATTQKALRESFPGEVFGSASAHRAEVDRLLLGLGEDRYRALLELLIELRRPQLSRGFDAERLERMLSGSLRPVPAEALAAAADAFEGLDRQKSELEQLRLAAAAANGFMGVYRRYAQAAARRMAEPVRKSHAVYEESMRKARKLAGEAEAADAELGRLNAEREALRRERAACRGSLQALRTSPELRSAQRLARLAEEAAATAKHARGEADRAATLAGDRDRAAVNLEAEQAALAGREATVGERLRETAVAADGAVLGDRHRADVEKLVEAERPDRAREAAAIGRLKERAITQAGAVRRLRTLHREREDARRAAAQRADAAREQRGRVDAARAEAAEAAARVEAAAEAFLEAFDAWAAGLIELPLDASAVREQLETWLEAETSGADWPGAGAAHPPLEVAADAAADARRTEIAAGRALVEARRSRLSDERAELEQSIADLESGVHEPPPAPHTRAADARPGNRPGAPLWRLVGFRENLPEDERAGVEAALEAAGLLDAWVGPDGDFPADDSFLLPHDASAAPRPSAAGRTLADALVADVAAVERASGVDAERVEGILRSVALGDSREAAVQPDGRFRLGPLAGRWHKPRAEHIGESAREAQRRRRLEALREQLRENAAADAEAKREVERLDVRSGVLRRERAAAPGAGPLRTARADADACERRVTDERTRLIESERREREAAAAAEAAAAELARAAAAAGLADHTDRLDAVADAVAAYANAIDRLAHAWTGRAEIAERVAAAEDAFSLARTRHAEAATAAGRASEASAQKAGEHAELDATLGDDAREVQKKLRAAEAQDERLEAGLDEKAAAIEATTGRQAAAHTKRDEAEARRLEHEVVRDAEIDRLRSFAAEGLLDACGGAGEPAPAEADAPETPPAGTPSAETPPVETPPVEALWSATAGVGVARRINDRFAAQPFDDAAYDRLSKRLEEAFHGLKDELGRQNHTAEMEPLFGGTVRKVSVRLGRDARPVQEVAARLAERIAHLDRMLDAEERRVIEDFLLDRCGAELHACMDDARRLVRAMSDELESHVTATGMRLRFRWKLDEDDESAEATRDAVAMLLRSPTAQGEEDRRALGRFLQGRIRRAREGQDSGGGGGAEGPTWADALAAALDYRAWHRFGIERQQTPDAPWKRLTRETFGTGSGGEKALMLTLPQFAAASAHYRSARDSAPRLVMLDEAFAGIDAGNRGQAMGVLQRFDLDFVMTSDREQGCYPELLGNAIYHLGTRPGVDAVLCTRQVWNGTAVETPPEHGGAHG